MKQLDISVSWMLCHLWIFTRAEFQNDFKGITRKSDLLLTWDPINTTDYPLVIHSRLINQTSQYGANSLEVNVTIGLNASSFLWKSVPYPLPYFETAKYEVEVWPQDWGQSVSAFASSSYFTISESKEGEDMGGVGNTFNDTIVIPSKPTTHPVSKGGINNNTAIAAGLVVPIVVIIAVFGFVLTQKRQKRILEERRKQRNELYID